MIFAMGQNSFQAPVTLNLTLTSFRCLSFLSATISLFGRYAPK